MAGGIGAASSQAAIPLVAESLSLGFGGEQLWSNRSFQVPVGGRVVLSGKSGAGKSSLLQMALGFLAPQSGSLHIFGREPAGNDAALCRSQMAWLPQNPVIEDGPVYETILLPFSFKHNRARLPDRTAIEAAMARVGIAPTMWDRHASSLSGGEKMRVALVAISLLNRPLLLLDEPTASLDRESARLVIRFIESFPGAVLIASHDAALVRRATGVVKL